QAGVALARALELLARARRIVAQARDLEAGLRPGSLQGGAALIQDHGPGVAEAQPPIARGRAEPMQRSASALAQPVLLEQREHRRAVAAAQLDHRAQLLVEQRRERLRAERVERDLEPGARGKRHLHQRDEQATIRTVVVCEQLAAAAQRLDRAEE